MSSNDSAIVLYHPQWQGCGDDESVLHGAAALRHRLYFKHGIKFVDIDPNPNISPDDLPDPGDPSNPPIKNLPALVANHMQVTNILESRNPRKIFTLGGDCGVSLAPFFWLNAKWQNLALLYLDAHGDLNTPASSPSGNFHGMVLRNLLDGRHVENYRAYPPLSAEYVALLGTRDLDPAEADYITENNITVIQPGDMATSGSERVLQFLRSRGLTKVYVHIDVDVFGPENFAYSFMKVPNGFPIDTVQRLLSDLRGSGDIEIVGGSMKEAVAGIEQDEGVMDTICSLFALLCAAAS